MENEQLTLKEAKELYIKAMDAEDERTKKEYMDRVIIGTLHFPYDFFENSQLAIFANPRFDAEDIKSACVEVWIEKIYNGFLVNHKKINRIIDDCFIGQVIKKLIGEETINLRQFYAGEVDFYLMFDSFLKLKNKGKEFSYVDVINATNKKEECKDCYKFYNIPDIGLYDLFERVYESLNIDKERDIEITKARLNNYYKLFVYSGIYSKLPDNIAYDDSFDEVTDRACYEDFVSDVDEAIQNERNIGILHKRFGLDSGEARTQADVAKEYNVSCIRIGQIEEESLRRIRKSKVAKKYDGVLE